MLTYNTEKSTKIVIVQCDKFLPSEPIQIKQVSVSRQKSKQYPNFNTINLFC